jgi:hypothetical protein
MRPGCSVAFEGKGNGGIAGAMGDMMALSARARVGVGWGEWGRTKAGWTTRTRRNGSRKGKPYSKLVLALRALRGQCNSLTVVLLVCMPRAFHVRRACRLHKTGRQLSVVLRCV